MSLIRGDVQQHILDNAKKMAHAVEAGIGPDVVIIVNSSDEQAFFWQGRLTGEDNIHGSGVFLKRDAIVLSVSEADWNGPAGNGLGTLNGLIQAARKAVEFDLFTVPVSSGIMGLAEELFSFCKDKSLFMFHTAGKGTRVAPLPAAEVNSKPNISLPRMIDVFEGSAVRTLPMTILESALRENGVYAHTRENRLSVFWGDQVIVNENDISFKGKHHVEIFGEMVPLTEDIKAYGVLVPGEGGDAKQREKLSMEAVKKLLPEECRNVYRSIGSFTVSFPFLKALIGVPEHLEALVQKKGKLDTDPDWWQPLTSNKEDYLIMMGEKRISPEDASRRWQIMSSCWETFISSKDFDNSGIKRLLGSTDVGSRALWWDYGQNKYYLENLQILTEDSFRGRAARLFFDIADGKWVSEADIAPGVSVEGSIIQNSVIKGGSVKNCVIVNSVLGNVQAEDSVIISGNIFRLNAQGALCYNVVSSRASLKAGQILVNVFLPGYDHPIEMRTDTGRDGTVDWKANDGKGEFIYDNIYTYPELAELMKGIRVREVSAAKKECLKRLLEKKEHIFSADERAKELALKRNITVKEARKIIEDRMTAFGDIE